MTMGLFDGLKAKAKKAEKALSEHPDQVRSAISKAGSMVDKQTNGKHHSQIVQAEAKAETMIDKQINKP
jgi:hypothetical protein